MHTRRKNTTYNYVGRSVVLNETLFPILLTDGKMLTDTLTGGTLNLGILHTIETIFNCVKLFEKRLK